MRNEATMLLKIKENVLERTQKRSQLGNSKLENRKSIQV